MKKIKTLTSRLPVIALLLAVVLALSFTKSHKSAKKYDRKTTHAKHISTESYSEEFTYFSTFADCYYMNYPYYFPDDTYYVDTDPSFLENGAHIYYDAEMTSPAPAGWYYFYHNEYAEFYRCEVDASGEIVEIDFCF